MHSTIRIPASRYILQLRRPHQPLHKLLHLLSILLEAAHKVIHNIIKINPDMCPPVIFFNCSINKRSICIQLIARLSCSVVSDCPRAPSVNVQTRIVADDSTLCTMYIISFIVYLPGKPLPFFLLNLGIVNSNPCTDQCCHETSHIAHSGSTAKHFFYYLASQFPNHPVCHTAKRLFSYTNILII